MNPPNQKFACLNQAAEFIEAALDVIDTTQQARPNMTEDQRQRLDCQLDRLASVITELTILAMEN